LEKKTGNADQLARNTLFSFVSYGLNFFFSTLVIFAIARVFSVEIFGIFTFSQNYTGLFAILADFGISIYLTREIAHKNIFLFDNFSNIIKVKILISIFTFLIVIVSCRAIGYPAETASTISYLTIAVILNSFVNLYKGYYRGIEKLEYEALISGLSSFVLFVFVITAIYINPDIVFVAKVYVLSRMVGVGITIIIARNIKGLYRKNPFTLGFIKDFLRQASPYALQTLFGIIYFQIDAVMLERMRGNYEVGIYQLAVKIILIGLVFCDVIQNAFLPTLSRLMKESFVSMINVAKNMNKYLLTLGIFFFIIVFDNAEDLINLTVGEKYLASVTVLKLLSLLLVIRLLAAAYGVVLTAVGRQELRMYSTIVASFFNIILNYILISRYGYLGAAITSILTNALVLVLFLVFSYRFTKSFLFDKKLINFVFVILAWGISNMLSSQLGFFASGILTCLVFIAAVYLLILENQERQIITTFISRLRG
jgi:O-antigen/teichoic acid export membrane protein